MGGPVGYLWDEGCLGHFTSTVHAERPERLEPLRPQGLLADLPGLRLVRTDPALGLPAVRRLHDPDYVRSVQLAWQHNRLWLDGGDTVVRGDTFDTALLAASGALSLLRAVAEGTVRSGFAAIPPPGHHAGRNRARGFCVFNNVAVCARHAQHALGVERVLVLDWDVHPADGTMTIFYEDPTVHVVSVHQEGILSNAVGIAEQRGRGAGEGSTWNIPLEAGSRGPDYLRALEPVLEEAAALCRPDLVLVSCGFDAHAADPIGGMRLFEDDFAAFTRLARGVAERFSGGRLVSLLEGGYNPKVLRRCARSHLEALGD